MEIGAILTKREAEKIRQRLVAIGKKTEDIRAKNQLRLIACDINKGGRRAARHNEPKLF